MINTMWFLHTSGPPTQVDVASLAQDAGAQWAVSAATLLSSDVTFLYALATDYTVENSWQSVSTSGNVPGTAADAMPNNVALAFSFRNGKRGRANRGRVYIGGIPRGAVVENEVSAAGFTTDMLIALNGFVGPDTISVGWELAIAHRRYVVAGEEFWLDPAIITAVTQVTLVDDTVDSQRRRLPGRGR